MRPSNKEISEAFATGNYKFAEAYLADNIVWNILGENPVVGKDAVLEVGKLSQLESFPTITIKTVVSEGNYVVIESTGEANTKNGQPYNQTYCDIYRFSEGKLQEITTYLDTELNNKTS